MNIEKKMREHHRREKLALKRAKKEQRRRERATGDTRPPTDPKAQGQFSSPCGPAYSLN